MSTYWDDFIRTVSREHLANLTPTQLCEEFYKWLVAQPNFILDIKTREAE